MRPAAAGEAIALAAVGLIGLAAFLYPLSSGVPASGTPVALFVAFLLAAVAIVLALALQTHRLSARLLAVLAALVAVDATLRLTVVVGLWGFSPIFFLILAAGFVMGPGFGFALGALTLLVSAAITAGVGPWLPYQMLAAGWIGMGAGLLERTVGATPSRGASWRWRRTQACRASGTASSWTCGTGRTCWA